MLNGAPGKKKGDDTDNKRDIKTDLRGAFRNWPNIYDGDISEMVND